MDVGLSIETRYFVSLLTGSVAPRMVRTLFLSLQDANKLIRRPAHVPKTNTTKVGIIGAGLMGAGIANTCAKARIHAILLDRDMDSAERGKAYSEKRLDKAISRGRSTAEKKAEILSRITPTTNYAALADCQLVIEAVFEDRAVKATVTKQAEAVLSPHAVIASNTSTLPISGLAEAAERQSNFIGLHFFSPVEKMPLVEVIRGRNTSDETLALALDFVQQIGKTPIVVNDARGFYTSRVFGTYITEGMSMLSEGLKPALIEQAGRMSGMPMPPLALADEVGLGLMHQVGKQTRADLGDDAPDNPSTPILHKMVVDLERKGRSGHAGFYSYQETGKHLWSGLDDHFPLAHKQPSAGELITRYLFVQAIEAARCMAEGVLLAAADADVGAVMGWGFAPYTGGPLSYIDSIGLPEFVAEADHLAAGYGDRFVVPDLLRAMARDGQRFYGENAR
jgi:3-hydroxyacyl-CoA dehydrogenase/enoyl-CoA hydratase/3-hydroxybutyryl-CoA epimerase